jgi:hypothetical protein
MISSVIPARLQFNCGHFALVSLPRLKGESSAQRAERVSLEKAAALGRACDFCGPREEALLEVRPVQDAVPSGDRNGHHAPDEKETPMHSTDTPSVTRLGADEARRTFPPRRRLDSAQEKEVTRLYAETTMPVPQISKQFSIGESSVYRIAARNGAGLRGRVQTASPVAPAAPAVGNGRRRRRAAAAPAATPTATVTRTRRTRTPAVARRAAPRAAAAATPAPTVRATRRPRATAAAASAGQRFQVSFRAETVIQAANIGAALRQLESLGATDVQSIGRSDK